MIRRCYGGVNWRLTIRAYDRRMTPEPATSRGRRLELAGTLVGALCVLAALAIIWIARLSVHYDLYVSELGAQGMPTAKWFDQNQTSRSVRPMVGCGRIARRASTSLS